jgi:hypothetical protein
VVAWGVVIFFFFFFFFFFFPIQRRPVCAAPSRAGPVALRAGRPSAAVAAPRGCLPRALRTVSQRQRARRVRRAAAAATAAGARRRGQCAALLAQVACSAAGTQVAQRHGGRAHIMRGAREAPHAREGRRRWVPDVLRRWRQRASVAQ